jgi:hypothetical protein
MEDDTIKRERVRELLRYSSCTGTFTWLESRGGVAAGSIAGCLVDDGGIQIRVDGKVHKAHRLAFLWMLGWMPKEVDHINHVRRDNSWINLRPATRVINSRNLGMSKANTSGITGVGWHKRDLRWRAQIRVNSEYIYLGSFVEKEDAISARKAAEVKYEFHENHGLRV